MQFNLVAAKFVLSGIVTYLSGFHDTAVAHNEFLVSILNVAVFVYPSWLCVSALLLLP